MKIKFANTSAWNRQVFVNDTFVGELSKVRRTRQELGGTVGWYEWEGTVSGVEVRGSLTQCREALVKNLNK